MGDSLTSDLALKLQQATQDVNRFVDNQVDLLESSDMNFEQTIEDSESTMEALSRNENNLDGLRIRQNAIKERQQGEIIEIKSDIDQLRKEQLQLQPEIKKLQEEEITELQRLENFKKGLLESRAAREKALNDLTKGIKLYQQLGLQFEFLPKLIHRIIPGNLNFSFWLMKKTVTNSWTRFRPLMWRSANL